MAALQHEGEMRANGPAADAAPAADGGHHLGQARKPPNAHASVCFSQGLQQNEEKNGMKIENEKNE